MKFSPRSGPAIALTGMLSNDLWGQANHKLLREYKLPDFAGGGQGTDFKRAPLNAAEGFNDFFKTFKDKVLAGELQRETEKAADAQRKLTAEMDNAKSSMASLADAANPYGVKKSGAIRPEILELAKSANLEFGNPKEELDKFLTDAVRAHMTLDPKTNKPLIDDYVLEKIWGKKVSEVAGRMGIQAGERKLSDAAIVGSVEDARLLQHFKAGYEGQPKTETLLQMIYDLIKERFNEADKKDILDRFDQVFNFEILA